MAIKIRRYLGNLLNELDSDALTPSDYTIMARNLPLNKSQEQLKQSLN